MNKRQELKELKVRHTIFFDNKPVGERHEIYKGFLITSANYDYIGYVAKVWQENENGNLRPVSQHSSVSDAKLAIDKYS